MIKYRCFIASLLFSLIFLGACSDNPSSNNNDDLENGLESRSFLVGVSGLIPKNYPNPSDSDWQNLFNTLPEYGEYLGMHVGWNEGEADQQGIPLTVNVAFDVTDNQTIQPYVAIGFEPDELSQEEADNYIAENGQDFLAVCVEIAQKHQPAIMLIGVEINRYFEKSEEGFSDFVDLYPDIYQAIKDVSPATLVGSNFQLDYMRGEAFRSGAEHDPHWEIINNFEPVLDIVSFTAFPYFDYDEPNEIPDNYFTEIGNHTSQPVMITETGWPSKPVSAFPGISASEDLQVEYFDQLLALTEPLPLHTLIWSFQHDPEIGIAGGLFDYIGLKNNDGSPKKMFTEWTELVERPVE